MVFHYLRYGLNLISSIIKPPRVFNRPIHLQLEPTTHCNLVCPQCPRDQYIENAQHMGFKQFKYVIDLLKPTHLTLSGLGEPTLNPELFHMISYAKLKNINVNTTSNFVSIQQTHIDSFVSSNLNLLNVSIDAACLKTYFKIRSKDAFHQVTRNVRKLIEHKERMRVGTPLIRVTFVIQKENLIEMAPFYEMAKNLGVDAVLYQIFSDSLMDEKKCLIHGIRIEDLESSVVSLETIERNCVKPTANTRFLKEKMAIIRKIYLGEPVNLVKKCIKPWISLYIAVNGDVRPCCSFGAEDICMGNIFHINDIREIFNNDSYRKFRNKLRTGRIPHPICSRCIPESIIDIVKRIRWTPNFIKPLK